MKHDVDRKSFAEKTQKPGKIIKAAATAHMETGNFRRHDIILPIIGGKTGCRLSPGQMVKDETPVHPGGDCVEIGWRKVSHHGR